MAPLFVTDFVLFKNNMPLLFSKAKVEEIEGRHYTIERGLGYYVITDTDNVPQLYVFGNKIN